MNVPHCPFCRRRLHRGGHTSSGKTRWRCRVCGISQVQQIDKRTHQFKQFMKWLLGRTLMRDMPGGGRTFRRHTAWCWDLWPVFPTVDEVHPVVFIDGIYLGRQAVVLIASTPQHVLGWYLAKTEHSGAYQGLMKRIAVPYMVVSDGGTGFAKALRTQWPDTKHQRCLVHASRRVTQFTTQRPKTAAGRDLLVIARALTVARWGARRGSRP